MSTAPVVSKSSWDQLCDVPWKSSCGNVEEVLNREGHRVGLNDDGYAVWRSGPNVGGRIPLDAHGPWRAVKSDVPLVSLAEIAEILGEHRGELSCVGPAAWEARCECTWSSGYFHDSANGDEARWTHDDHVAQEIYSAIHSNG